MQLSISSAILLVVAVSSVRADWERYERAMRWMAENPAMMEGWDAMLKRERPDGSTRRGAAPMCPAYSSATEPTSVHKLTPGDIKVVGAMGDSYTAANGADAWFTSTVLREYRGYAFAIGGYKSYPDVITMPNILRLYNPDLTGYSTGTGDRDSSVSRLNVAYPGNTAENMPEQARMLIQRAHDFEDVDMANDWKMVTIFIGGNDLCRVCNKMDQYSTENYVKNLKLALDLLQAGMPKTLVNVISIMDVVPVSNMKWGIRCRFVHWLVCDCAEDDPELLTAKGLEYSDAIEKLIKSGRYNTTDDFTVVFQPFMRDSDLPKDEDGDPDHDYFAPDCFHLSKKGHAAVATMYWNGLFEPVGKKRTAATFDEDLICPAEGTLIQTNRNADGQ